MQKLVNNLINLHPGRYTKVTSGASCEANGFGSITSDLECQTAPQELGLSLTWRGTINAPGPPGCYHRFDGDLWYNVNGQPTEPCTSQSICVCKTGKPFCWKWESKYDIIWYILAGTTNLYNSSVLLPRGRQPQVQVQHSRGDRHGGLLCRRQVRLFVR